MKSITFILVCLLGVGLSGQETILNNETDLKDGVYLSHKDLLSNAPTIKFRELVCYNEQMRSSRDNPFLDRVSSSSLRIDCETIDLWGFCSNGNLYIKIGETNRKNENDEIDSGVKSFYFAKVVFRGHLCYYYVTTYVDPAKLRVSSYMPTHDPMMKSAQFLVKLSTGEKSEFSSSGILRLISDDKELYDKFKKMSKRKKKKEIFNIYREYNKRNPIVLPIED